MARGESRGPWDLGRPKKASPVRASYQSRQCISEVRSFPKGLKRGGTGFTLEVATKKTQRTSNSRIEKERSETSPRTG